MSEIEWFGAGLPLLAKGGVVMYVLFALSVLALAIILLKLFHFIRAGVRRTGFVEDVLAALTRGDTRAARNRLGVSAHPVAPVMQKAIETAGAPGLSLKDRDAEISRVGSNQIRRLESHLGSLEIIANLSPLLGLLGTVLGMITAFAELEQAGAEVDPTILAGGIWEALLTTAFGLSIAIPALGAFYLLEGEVERVRNVMKDAVVRINAVLGAAEVEDET